MTPERAIEIANEHDAKGDPLNIIAAILAACEEERYEALTEAVLSVDRATEMPGLARNQVIAIKGICLRLLVLRDQPKE